MQELRLQVFMVGAFRGYRFRVQGLGFRGPSTQTVSTADLTAALDQHMLFIRARASRERFRLLIVKVGWVKP